MMVLFTKRTDYPKLGWLMRQLDVAKIEYRLNGQSAHAPILEVEAGKIEEAWSLLPLEIDDLPDDDPMFGGNSAQIPEEESDEEDGYEA